MNYREPIHDIGPIDKLHEVNCNVSSVITSPTHIWHLNLITAHKRSLRRLCLYTCLSFCPQRGGVCPSACWDAHPPGPEAGIPLGAVHAGKYGQQVGSTHPTGMHSCYCPQKQNLGQGNIFAPVCHSVHRRGVWFRGCLIQGVSVPRGGLVPVGASKPTPKGKIEGDQVQAHTQGGN